MHSEKYSAINRYLIIALTLWLMTIVIAIPTFWYIAKNPETLLFIEAAQPAEGVKRGLALLQENKAEEAIYEMNRALDFWQNLYEESGQRSHQIHLALTYSALATVLADHGNPDQQQKALDYFQSALEIDPTLSLGQTWLNYGNLLFKFEQYQQAVDAYTKAIAIRFAPICLQAYWKRGETFLKLNQTQDAAEDWAAWLPFDNRNEAQKLETLRKLPHCESFDCLLIQSYVNQHSEPTVAINSINQALKINPDDRFARYLNNVLTKKPMTIDEENIDLNDVFPPPLDENNFLLKNMLINLYAPEDTVYQLTMVISQNKKPESLPQLIIRGPKSEESLLVSSVDKTRYTTNIPVNPGKNLLSVGVPVQILNQTEPELIFHEINIIPIKQ